MKLRWLVLVLVFITSAGPARAEGEQPTNLWFQVGEEQIYDIEWGFLDIGQTHVTTSWEEFEGRRVIAIRFRTKTYGLMDSIYPVNDLLESLVDPETFLPLRFVKKLSEGKYRADEVTLFDHANKIAKWESHKSGKKKEFAIAEDTRDIISLMYYLRKDGFNVGGTTVHRIMADEKLYEVFVKPKKIETVKLDRFGKIETIRVEPEAAFQGLFVRKGKVTFWVSQDERRLCARMMAEVPVANIRLSLNKVLGPGDDLWVKPVKDRD